MSDSPRSSSRSRGTPGVDPMTARVLERLDVAGKMFDRRHRASRPKSSRKPARGALGVAPSPAEGEAAIARERACLRSVFRELGDAHRRYRLSTGRSGTVALREAAHAFKREPSVGSLVPVAALLDELGLLAW